MESPEQKILQFFSARYVQDGVPPTVKEAAETLHCSVSTVFTYLQVLVAKEKMRRVGRKGYVPTGAFEEVRAGAPASS